MNNISPPENQKKTNKRMSDGENRERCEERMR